MKIADRWEMIKAIEKVVKHWKGRDCDAQWIQPLKEILKREHKAYTNKRADITNW